MRLRKSSRVADRGNDLHRVRERGGVNSPQHIRFDGLEAVEINGERHEIDSIDAHVGEDGVTGIAVRLLPPERRITLCLLFDPNKENK